MNYDRMLSKDIGKVIERMQVLCSKFYDRHEKLLFSIVLAGSLARGEISEKNVDYDADILVVTRHYYNPILSRFLKMYLKKTVGYVKFDFGRSYPLSRLRREKSLFLYDIKNNGIILAGNDVREIIQEHTFNDLYPCESIRLLLNASCRLAFTLGQGEAKIKRELDKAMRCCIDTYLLHYGRFAPTLREREIILKREHLNVFKHIKDVVECNDLDLKYSKGRQEILIIMNLMKERLGLDTIESLVDYLRERSKYSFPVRLYTLIISRRFESIFKNPIFDIYVWALSMLEKHKRPNSLEPSYAYDRHFRNIWVKLPQPIAYT